MLHLANVCAGCQPQRQVVDTGVACQAFKISFADDHSTKLAGIVAPDASHIELGRVSSCY